MKLVEKTFKVIEMNVDESKVLVELLNYCSHRADCHNSPVSRYSNQIKKMRQELNIIKDN
jgi:hypothetical protein